MKSHLLTILLMLFFLKSVGQFDSLQIPKEFINLYYCNKDPKMVKGNLYNGTDSSIRTFEFGNLLAIETYENGFKTDLKTFFDNGQQECHFQWKNGKRHGISKKWYRSGKILFDFEMVNGKKNGPSIHFYENSNPKFIDDEKNGIDIEFYENGKMKRISKKINDSIKCKTNSLSREEIHWTINGQLSSKIIYNCGKQFYTDYYNDSSICCTGFLINMKLFLVGPYNEYYPNGNKRINGQYEDTNTQSEANIKTGVWKYWNEKGKLMKEEFYENNQLLKTKTYIVEKKQVNQIKAKD